MNRTQTTLLGLLLLQVVLILIFRSPLSGAPERTDTRPLLPELEALSAERLQVEGADGERITLERHGEDWTIDELQGFPADGDKVRSLLENLESIQVRRPVVSKASHHDAFKVTAENHEARVKIWGTGDDDPAVDLIVGSSANYRTTHVRRAGEDEVYEIQGLAPYDVRPAHASWIRKELADDVGEVTRITLRNGSGRFELERQDDRWQVVSPSDRRDEILDQEEVTALLRAVTGLRLSDAVGPRDDALQGFDPPAATLDLAWESSAEEDGSTSALTLLVGGKVADKETQRYVTRSDSGFTGTVWETSLDRLLDGSLDDLQADAETE